ncbi:hypothetical protein ABUK73_15555 [Agrobacterium sp. BA1120]|uniref:hypothetical protein n=1 Tax=Agrobacterium sp. BA1120 TaxID=3228927 RepID=UPI00336ADB79
MSIFVVFRVTNPQAVKAAIEASFPHDHYQADVDEWIISANMTAKELSDTLRITGGENGSGIVFKMASYYGRAATDLWDWIKTKSEGDN